MLVQHANPSFADTTVCPAVGPGLAVVLPTSHKTQLHRTAFAGLASMAVNSTTVVVHTLAAVAGYACTIWKWQGASLDAIYVTPFSGLRGANKLPGIYVTLSRVRTRAGLVLSSPLPPLETFKAVAGDPLLRFDAMCDADSDSQLRRLGLVPSPRTL